MHAAHVAVHDHVWLCMPGGGGGGVLWISSDGDDQMGEKSNLQKIPRPNKQLQNKFGCTLFAELRDQDTKPPQKILAKFFYPKKSRNQKFQTPKNPLIITVTWNLEYPPQGCMLEAHLEPMVRQFAQVHYKL